MEPESKAGASNYLPNDPGPSIFVLKRLHPWRRRNDQPKTHLRQLLRDQNCADKAEMLRAMFS
jgi:hypothetical protein